uniref:PiggyBac transposable element-derived protein domain-containing protein n=1 Tax=Sipha flava TaxID=143950 RepID=A0A2S2QZJ1_9HEMI
MNHNLNDDNIVDYLFEDLPSDDNSLTDIDDFDDHDYLPSQQKAIEVVESSSSDENEESNELVEILCLNNGDILTLPSPKKTRYALKLNSNATLTPETNNMNLTNKRKKTISRALFEPPSTIDNTIVENTPEFEFTPPNWSKNLTSNWPPLPDFESPVGPSDSVDTFQCHTPYSIFNYLFSDEIIHMLVEQTNLYSFQRSQTNGKPYTQTNIQELKTFFWYKFVDGY